MKYYNNSIMEAIREHDIVYHVQTEAKKAELRKNRENIFDTLERDWLLQADSFSENLVLAGKIVAYTTLRKIYQTSADERVRRSAIGVWIDDDNDGHDITQQSIMLLLEALDSGRRLQENYTIKRLSKKVLIKDSDSCAYKEEVTCPLREVYRGVRRYISNNRSFTADTKYMYLEELVAKDDIDGEEFDRYEKIYRRLPFWLAMELTVDIRGSRGKNTTTITTNEEGVQAIKGYVSKLNLTATQSAVLKLRLRGYGNKAIATYRGTSDVAVIKTKKQIAKKAESIGLKEAIFRESERAKDYSAICHDIAEIESYIEAEKKREARKRKAEKEAIERKAREARHNLILKVKQKKAEKAY